MRFVQRRSVSYSTRSHSQNTHFDVSATRVFKAQNIDTGAIVGLKIMRMDQRNDPELVREIRIMQQVRMRLEIHCVDHTTG